MAPWAFWRVWSKNLHTTEISKSRVSPDILIKWFTDCGCRWKGWCTICHPPNLALSSLLQYRLLWVLNSLMRMICFHLKLERREVIFYKKGARLCVMGMSRACFSLHAFGISRSSITFSPWTVVSCQSQDNIVERKLRVIDMSKYFLSYQSYHMPSPLFYCSHPRIPMTFAKDHDQWWLEHERDFDCLHIATQHLVLDAWKGGLSVVCGKVVNANGIVAKCKRSSVVRRLTIGPTGHSNPARDSNPESPDFSAWLACYKCANQLI